MKRDTGTRRCEAVLFDLDGTLVHSWPLHLDCLRRTAEAIGMRPPTLAALTAAQRPTDRGTLEALVGRGHAEAAADAYSGYLREALTRAPDRAVPVAGVAATLTGLRAAGIRVGVCTGRSRRDAGLLLLAAGLCLPVVVGYEDASAPKPAPDGLLLALARLKTARTSALFVGDSRADEDQGLAAGVAVASLRRVPQAGPRLPSGAPNGRPACPVLRITALPDLLDLLAVGELPRAPG
jgi:phosphoglycolate phosphatase-like HAD superfamily hydrolase